MSNRYSRSSEPRTTAVQQNKLTVNCFIVDDIDSRKANGNAIWPWNGGMDEHYTEVNEGDILFTTKDLLENYNTSATMHSEESSLVPVSVAYNGYGDVTRGDSIFAAMNIFLENVKIVGVSPRAYTTLHNGPVTADKRGIITMVNGPKSARFGDIAIARPLAPGEISYDSRPNAKRGIIKNVVEPLSKRHMYPLVKDMLAIETGSYLSQNKTFDPVESEYVTAIKEFNDSIMTLVYCAFVLLKNDSLMDVLNNTTSADSKAQFFETLIAAGPGSFREKFFEMVSNREEFRRVLDMNRMTRTPNVEYLENASEGALQNVLDPIIQYHKGLMNWRVGTYNVTTSQWAPTEVDLKL